VNTVLREARGDVILLIDADCLPAEGALPALLAPFDDAAIGGAGPRNVPANGDENWVARAGAALWDLHHEVNLRRPVLGGDIVAFRPVLDSIPESTVNDDYVIEADLRRLGPRIAYAPDAVVRMRVPSTIADFMRQRRRIAAGFARETRTDAVKGTQAWSLRLSALGAVARRQPARLPALALLLALEAAATLSVAFEGLRGRNTAYTAWQPAASTKRPLQATTTARGAQHDIDAAGREQAGRHQDDGRGLRS
jgi:hypothetical protein